jgi:ATP-dependent DNA helicase PIF1
VFAGNFKQTLPVVKFDEYPASQNATIKSLKIWGKVTKYALTITMRLGASAKHKAGRKNMKFEASLLLLGKGRGQAEDFGLKNLRGVNLKSLTESAAESEALLIDFVYGDLKEEAKKPIDEHGEYLFKQVILATLNRDVRTFNSLVTSNLPGKPVLSTSIDMPDPKGYNNLLEECLNKISVSSLLEHLITLKVGMPVVITQNLYSAKGMCKGTHMIVVEIKKEHIVGCLLSGPFKGDEIMIPKIKLHHKGSMTLALSFYRYQFPLIPAYAMSINKSQGQTLAFVGVLLETDVFAHSQLYVVCSRVTNCRNLLVVKPASRPAVVNVVHHSIFEN